MEQKGSKIRFSIGIDPSLYMALKKMKTSTRLSMSWIIEESLLKNKEVKKFLKATGLKN